MPVIQYDLDHTNKHFHHDFFVRIIQKSAQKCRFFSNFKYEKKVNQKLGLTYDALLENKVNSWLNLVFDICFDNREQKITLKAAHPNNLRFYSSDCSNIFLYLS